MSLMRADTSDTSNIVSKPFFYVDNQKGLMARARGPLKERERKRERENGGREREEKIEADRQTDRQ